MTEHKSYMDIMGLKPNDPFDAIEGKFAVEEHQQTNQPLFTATEKRAIMKKAAAEAYHQFYKTAILRQSVLEFMTEGKTPFNGTENEEVHRLMLEQYKTNSTKSPYWLITINPKPGTELEDLDKVVAKILRKKTIQSFAFVYEIRKKEDDIYTGLHCHILVYQTLPSHDFKRGVQNTCKHICQSKNPNILNFKNVPEDAVQQKIEYLLGNKTDKKELGVALTMEWREANEIPPILESDPPLPCRVTQTPLLIEHPDSEDEDEVEQKYPDSDEEEEEEDN